MVNGLLMLISFFLCRVMLFPVLYWWYSSVLGLSLLATISTIPCWVNIATLGLWTPQLFWFNKILQGSIKVIRDQQRRLGKSDDVSSKANAKLEEDKKLH